MGRHKYQVSTSDYSEILQYLDRNRKDLYHQIRKAHNPESLQKVIDDYMTDKEIRNMRSSVRMERSRGKKYKRPDINITLSNNAHKELKKLAEEENLTLSECVEKYFYALSNMLKFQREEFIKKHG